MLTLFKARYDKKTNPIGPNLTVEDIREDTEERHALGVLVHARIRLP